MQATIPVKPDSLQLDALIAKLKERRENELLIEHLQTASAYLQGAMPEECSHNLQMARGLAGNVSTKSLEGDLRDTIADLLQGLHPAAGTHWKHRDPPNALPAPRPGERLQEFFHGASSSLGIFYPKKHVIAVFRSFHQADVARQHLRADGLRSWETIAAPGYEIDEFISSMRANRSLWSRMTMQFSRLLDTEAGLIDRYAKWARRGAGFVAVYSPTEEQADQIGEILRPMKPVAMHWFMAGFIQHLQ
jgi:hypothetical protein